MFVCPCCSGKTYTECCEPVINNEATSTALALMRSRYTAYYTKQEVYLYKTTHPKTRVKISLTEIEEWSKVNSWTKLEIINIEKGTESDSRGVVEFKAHFMDKKGLNQIQHEKSTFIKEGGQWFYLDGIVNLPNTVLSKTISRNTPCSCGSGKKFKHCCG